jgi:UDP-N-acetylglucosamine 1-carboxyvinyltransferase
VRSIVVNGGGGLTGTVRVEGAKNSALKLMAASILAPGVSRISNVPDISDMHTMRSVLEGLGAEVDRTGHTLTIDTTRLASDEAPYELVARMRASISVLGPLLGRSGHARVAMPGGCNIGSRKIDLHMRGLEELGVEITTGHGYIEARADGLVGAPVTLDFPSVGATENILMAAVLAEGATTIENAAREPEIQDLAGFLVSMGARIEGAGTPTISIEGVRELAPTDHSVIGDRIEAGTFLVGGVLAGGPVTVEGVDPAHLDMVLTKLEQAGADVGTGEDSITVGRSGPVTPADVATLPYPGFPTDMQPQFMALLAIADGNSVITENVFENRFIVADEFNRMGASVTIESHHALIRGVAELSGAPVRCPDLRAGAALVMAGLVAEGTTTVTDAYHIERGYERFVEKLSVLGGDVAYADS